jgi:uncharacterized protein (DUF2147 family)
MAKSLPVVMSHRRLQSRFGVVIGFAVSLGGCKALAQPPSIDGRWLSGDGERVVEIGPCVKGGETRCGTVIWLQSPTDTDGIPVKDTANPDPALKRRPICGLQVVGGFSASDRGGWSGQIYDIDTGQSRRGELRLESDSLRVHFDQETLDTQGDAGQVWARMTRLFARCSPR